MTEDQEETPIFVIAIVENGAGHLSDILEHLVKNYDFLPVKIGSLTNKQLVESTTIGEYYARLMETCNEGTFRYGPLNALSLVGTKQEECGDFFGEIIVALEKSPILKRLLPWSERAITCNQDPKESDDGPIFWARPGEQMIRTDEIGKEDAKAKKRKNGFGGCTTVSQKKIRYVI